MSRARILVVAAVLVLFAAAGGVLIYATGHHGGGQNLTFDLTVSGAKSMTPSEISAHVNDTITINVTSDVSGEVHLHVYDLPFDTVAGKTVSRTFKADKTCHCDIEWESTSTPLGVLTVNP